MFENKVVVITGGAGGIGWAMARAFGERGAKVMLADLDEEGLEAAVADLRSERIDAIGTVTDVADGRSVEALAAKADEEFGGADIVCNNAGVAVFGSVVDAPTSDWEFTVSVNLYGVVNGIRSFVPRLLARGVGGHIVNTASMSGLVGMEHLGVYCASKFAVVGLSESLARELQHTGIGVSVVCPMVVDTAINENSERLRPARSPQSDPPESGAMVGGVIEAPEVAKRVIEAVEHGHLYVLTHPEQRAILARRAERLDEAAARVAG